MGNGETTSEPLLVIAADDLVSCAVYAKENDLLDLSGWKRFRTLAKKQGRMMREINLVKLRKYSTEPSSNTAMRYLKTSSMLWRLTNAMVTHCGRMPPS